MLHETQGKQPYCYNRQPHLRDARHSVRPLALSVNLQDRETPQSFVSRLSVRNGCATVQDFCRHMGIKWTDVVTGKGATLQHVGFLVGTSADDLERFAVKTQSYQRYTVNGQALTSWTTRRQDLRLCPACYAEDIQQDCADAAYGRVEWQLSGFRICPRHLLQILTLPASEYPRSPYDFAGRVSDNHQRILAAAENAKPQTQQAVVEPYLIARLTGDSSASWVDRLDLDIACKFIMTLGVVLEFGAHTRPTTLTEAQLAQACGVGLQATGSHIDDLCSTLELIAKRSTTSAKNFHKDFGALSCWLSRVDHSDARYEILLDCLSKFAFDHYPFASGHNLFGRDCSQRKVHNLVSASAEFGVSTSRLRKFLIAKKLPHNTFDIGVAFSAEQYRNELIEFAQCLSTTETAAKLGLSYDGFKRVRQSGKLAARFNLPGMNCCYHPNDIEAFWADILKQATQVSCVPANYECLTSLCRKTRCPVDEILDIVASGKLSSLMYSDRRLGFMGLYADPEEIWDQLTLEPPNGFSKAELKRLLRVNDTTIKFLVNRGFLNSKTINRSHTRRPIGIVSGQSLQKFLQDHVTLGLLASDAGAQAQGVYSQLSCLKVRPLPLPSGVSIIYSRSAFSDCSYVLKSPARHFEHVVQRLYRELRPNATSSSASTIKYAGAE